MAKIGVVTVLYNSVPVLEDFYESLNNQTFSDFVVYAVDNNSSDSSVEVVKKMASKYNGFRTVLLPQSTNVGVAAGNNIGIKEALKDECEYILLSNNDVVLEKDTIEKLLLGIEEYHADMASPKIYYWNTEHIIWQAGGKFDIMRANTPHNGYNCYDHQQYSLSGFVDYSSTCFMLINSSIFRDGIFMDENYFVYYDDADFVWRVVRNYNKKLVYVAKSVLWHKVSYLTKQESSSFAVRFVNRNKIYFVLKHYSIWQKMLFFTYSIVYFILKELFVYNKERNLLVLKSYMEGFRLYYKLFSFR